MTKKYKQSETKLQTRDVLGKSCHHIWIQFCNSIIATFLSACSTLSWFIVDNSPRHAWKNFPYSQTVRWKPELELTQRHQHLRDSRVNSSSSESLISDRFPRTKETSWTVQLTERTAQCLRGFSCFHKHLPLMKLYGLFSVLLMPPWLASISSTIGLEGERQNFDACCAN